MPVAELTRRSVAFVLVIAGSCAIAVADPPAISALSPRAVKPGATVDVAIHGKDLGGATGMWTSFSCDAALAPEIAENGKKGDQVVYRVKLASEVHVGVQALRLITPGGVSAPVLIAVDDIPSIPHQAGNTNLATAQPLPTPAAVDGFVGALSRNYYRFHVDEGQRVSIEVLARRLGSPLDPLIRLLDADGRELTYSDDEAGLSGDSQLCHTFKSGGDYVVEIRDVQYRGGEGHFFRLRIGDFPCVTVPYPMGVKRGSQVNLTFAGPNADDVEPVSLSVPADTAADWMNVGARRAGGQSSALAVLSVGDREEFLEAEPNNGLKQSNRIALGATINGRLDQPEDFDHFVFSAKSGQQYNFACITRRQGSPADLYCRLLKADGSQVAESKDAPENDGQVTYTFPEDGDYTLVVRDLSERGGSSFAYRIEASPVALGFSLAASSDRLNVPAGGVALVTVTAVRRGYRGPIAVSLADLPEKISSVPTLIGANQNSAVLTVKAAPDAPAGQPFFGKVVGAAKVGEADFHATAEIRAALKSTLGGMPFPPPLFGGSVALAVAPKPPFTLRTEPAIVTFGKNLSAKIKVIAERQPGFDEAIALAITPEKEGVPNGITPTLKPLEKGTNEVEITFAANDRAPLGEFTGVIVGTLKKDKATVVEPAAGIALKLEEPFRLKIDMGEAKLSKGGSLAIKASLERNPAFAGAVSLVLENLPNGVSAPAAEIAAGASQVEIMLAASQDAAVGKVENLRVKGAGKAGDKALSATSASATLSVE